ncbi:MAG: sulfatase-like hydrolase/transferase [Gemmatimonadota bacterium]
MPMNRRQFVAGTSAALAAAGAPWISRPLSRPNLLFILADDMGYGDLSSFGRRDYRTPELDRLGQTGVRFVNAYSAASVCTPTRGGFMTGRYPARLPAGLQQPMSWVNENDGLPPGYPTIASQLKERGYDTALIGKWHLGYRPEFGPLSHGFDEFFGILSGGVDYYTHRDALRKLDLHEGLVTVDKVGYLTDLLSERAVEYVSRSRSRPFYLSLQYTAPHWPWEGPGEHLADTTVNGFEGGGSVRVFGEMVRSLDTGIGKVVAALARKRIDRNTLVIFTSDNGGERYSNNWPYQKAKGTLWEGGIRVPALMHWPGTIPSGHTSEALAITMDWTATLLAAGGGIPATGYPLDGMDLLPAAKRVTIPGERTLFWRQPFMRYNQQPEQEAVHRGRWKYLSVDGMRRLFDIEADPGEKADLAGRHPGLLRSLQQTFERWNRELPARDPRPPQ